MNTIIRPTLLARARLTAFLLVSVTVAMTNLSCGGGGDGGGEVLGPVQTIENERLDGIWSGTSTSNGSTQALIGMTTEDGRFRFLSMDTMGQFIGRLSLSNQNQVSATGIAIAPMGSTWSDGSMGTTLSGSGTIAERHTFDVTWSTEAGDTGTINLTYDSVYSRASSITKVEGTYTSFDADGNPVGSLTIDSTGTIFGQDVSGCVYSGNLYIIDPAFNIYTVTLSLSGCGNLDGGYQGLACVMDHIAADDLLMLSVDNGVVYAIFQVYM